MLERRRPKSRQHPAHIIVGRHAPGALRSAISISIARLCWRPNRLLPRLHGFSYRWMTRYLALDQTDATKLLTRIRRQWFNKLKSIAALLRDPLHRCRSCGRQHPQPSCRTADGGHRRAVPRLLSALPSQGRRLRNALTPLGDRACAVQCTEGELLDTFHSG
jgi:hypothetical protein